MQYLHRFSQVGLLQKLMVVFLLSLLVSGENEEELKEAGTSISKQSTANVYVQQRQQEKRAQQQRLRHSFDAFFSDKRKVPNASDPLHNR